MNSSKSIRKKRRHSRKRNMKGGGLPTDMAILSYNTSFVLSMSNLYRGPGSENTSIYIRLMKLKSLMKDPGSKQDFIQKYYKVLFPMSCKKIAAFFDEYKTREYCVAALQEMNVTQDYIDTMTRNFGRSLTILACGVSVPSPVNVAGLAYVIPTDKLSKYKDKLNDYWFNTQYPQLYTSFNAQKVAIVDLGDHKLYKDNEFYKNDKGLTDSGRPMALIIRQEEDGYILHFNCHIPNPSALRSRKYNYERTILEQHFALSDSSNLDKLAEITHEAINLEAHNLLLKFFSPADIVNLSPYNCRIIFSGDFNDGSGKLMNLMKTLGLTVANSGLTNIKILFGIMPKSCCSNFNSVTLSNDPNFPPGMTLGNIYEQETNPQTNKKISDLLKSTDPTLSDFNYLVNTKNYDFKGDGTGSNIPLRSEIYDPPIVSDIPNITYSELKANHIEGSDHMPVVSFSFTKRILTSDLDDPNDADEYTNKRRNKTEIEDEDMIEDMKEGGYRKKRRSQKKLKQRKSKRYTKKRNYRKNKK